MNTKNLNILPLCFTLLTVALIFSCIFYSCGGSSKDSTKDRFTVSIEPLRFIVEGIVGDSFEVEVLVPPGASPETYEPTPKQMKTAEEALAVFSTGLIGFERSMLEHLPDPERVVNLSVGVKLIAGECGGEEAHGLKMAEDGAKESDGGHEGHRHEAADGGKECDGGHEGHGHNGVSEHGEHSQVHSQEHSQGHSHSHGGVDPHIWTSPKALLTMAHTAYLHLHELYPDSVSFTANYTRLAARLEALDREIGGMISGTDGGKQGGEASKCSVSGDGADDRTENVRSGEASGDSTIGGEVSICGMGTVQGDTDSPTRSFLIFHPGLTYYARDYGLQQIALEFDGKEPSVKQLQQTIELARAGKITKVLYQSPFPRSVVEVAAAEIGAEAVEIDILGYDIADNLLKITEIITEQQ